MEQIQGISNQVPMSEARGLPMNPHNEIEVRLGYQDSAPVLRLLLLLGCKSSRY